MIECVFLAGMFWLQGFQVNGDEFLVGVDKIQFVSPGYEGLTKTGRATIYMVGESLSVQDSVGEVLTALGDCDEQADKEQ